jgi:hypothetical protein
MNFPKSGVWMMLRQLFTSSHTGAMASSAFQSSHPLQLNPAAAIMMPNLIKNSCSVKGQTFAPLTLKFSTPTASLSLASLAFQSYVIMAKKEEDCKLKYKK